MKVTVCDVGPRDGLQNEAVTLPPSVRAELCDRLLGAGVSSVEAASFVNPRLVPQMAGAEEVLGAVGRRPGTVLSGLALNERGFERAVAALEAGATLLDASVGGTGGCPFAPRATGNIPTEDLVYLLHGMGIDTGIDLEALMATSRWLGERLGRELPALVTRAGDFVAVSGTR